MRCGYLFDNPRPSFESIVQYYSRSTKYDIYLRRGTSNTRLWKRRLAKVRNYRKSGRLLDIGAGIGDFLSLARDFFEIAGTEVSDSAISIAKEKYYINLVHGQIENDTFEQKFDIVTMFHVLEHVPNPLTTIRSCNSIMTDGGILVIAVPNDIEWLGPHLIRILKKFGYYKARGKLGLPKLVLDGTIREIHVSHFTAAVLEKFLIRNGFEVIETTLDRHYAERGLRNLAYDVFYYFSLLVLKAFKRNIFPTTWTAARKVKSVAT